MVGHGKTAWISAHCWEGHEQAINECGRGGGYEWRHDARRLQAHKRNVVARMAGNEATARCGVGAELRD